HRRGVRRLAAVAKRAGARRRSEDTTPTTRRRSPAACRWYRHPSRSVSTENRQTTQLELDRTVREIDHRVIRDEPPPASCSLQQAINLFASGKRLEGRRIDTTRSAVRKTDIRSAHVDRRNGKPAWLRQLWHVLHRSRRHGHVRRQLGCRWSSTNQRSGIGD